MRSALLAVAIVCTVLPSARAEAPPSAWNANWPQWRGPVNSGVAPHGTPPTTWSESENIRWKVSIPGQGHSTPIVWSGRVYVQTAVSTESPDRGSETTDQTDSSVPNSGSPTVYEFKLLALDRHTGRTIWARTLCKAVPHEAGHDTASQASNSPITDGEHVYAYFGSRGLHCVDLKGEVVWSKDFGQMQTRRGFGEGSSPALHGDTIVIVWDHEGDDFIVALDKRTGAELWRAARDEPTAWATPVIIDAGGRPQVVASATNAIRGYDLRTGEVIWHCGGMTMNVVPTPVVADGLLYAASGFRGNALLAIRYADARGEITDSAAVAWRYGGKGTPYVPSPVVHEGRLYFLSGYRAQLTCLNAKTGETYYDRERLPELREVYASPVAADGKVYVVGREGHTAVIAPGSELKVVAVNTLDERFDASPVIVGSELFLRGRSHLYCIAK